MSRRRPPPGVEISIEEVEQLGACWFGIRRAGDRLRVSPGLTRYALRRAQLELEAIGLELVVYDRSPRRRRRTRPGEVVASGSSCDEDDPMELPPPNDALAEMMEADRDRGIDPFTPSAEVDLPSRRVTPARPPFEIEPADWFGVDR